MRRQNPRGQSRLAWTIACVSGADVLVFGEFGLINAASLGSSSADSSQRVLRVDEGVMALQSLSSLLIGDPPS